MNVITECPQCQAHVAKFEVNPNPKDLFSSPNISLNSFLVAGTKTHCVIESEGSYTFRCNNTGCKWHERIPTVYFSQVLGQAARDKIRVVEMIPSEIQTLHREYELDAAAVRLKSYRLPPKKFARKEVKQAFLEFFRHDVQTFRTGARPRKGSKYYGLMSGASISPPDPFRRDLSEIFEQYWTEAERRRPSV